MFDPFLSDYRPENSRVYMPQAVFGEIGGMKSLADGLGFLLEHRTK